MCTGQASTLLSLELSVVPATLPADSDGGDPDSGDDSGSLDGLYALLLIPVVGADCFGIKCRIPVLQPAQGHSELFP